MDDPINAAGVVTVTASPMAKIYDEKGVALTDHGLATGSKWKTDIAITIDGKVYFRIAVNEFLSQADVTFAFA